MVVKQIIFNELNGRLVLSDDNNNHYLCDIYGNKIPNFLDNISGTCSYNERIEKLKNSDVDYVEKPIDNFEKNKYKYYLPSIRKFEGYSSFPNPLTSPMSNIPKYEVTKKNKEKLIALLKENFKNEKNLRMANIPEDQNNGMHYFSYPVNPDDYSKKDRDNLIKLIDNHFEEYKVINKYKLNLMPKDPVIKALKKFRKLLMDNEDLKVINGRKLPKPSDEVKDKYNVINSMIKHVGLSPQKKVVKDSNSKNVDLLPDSKKYKTKNEAMNFSFLSVESENEKKYAEENLSSPLKSLENLRNSLTKEKKMITGFKEKIEKEAGIIRKRVITKFKSPGELYDKDMELSRKGI